jgi:hypothetical protein
MPAKAKSKVTMIGPQQRRVFITVFVKSVENWLSASNQSSESCCVINEIWFRCFAARKCNFGISIAIHQQPSGIVRAKAPMPIGT